MKKSLIKVVVALIILTILIAIGERSLEQRSLNSIEALWTTGDIKHNDNIIKKDEKSLNGWLSLYNSGLFQKVEIEDWITLKWYILSWSEEKNTIFPLWWTKIIDNYYLITTKKPADTSVIDLWLSLTWDTSIKTIYNEESILVSFLKEFWWLILFFLVFIIGFRLIMWRGNWAWWLMDIKVWKKSTKETSKTRFSDVAWMEEVKNELMEVVDYLKNPEKYRKVWARHPKWILLYGEPGSGKTLLARAVAGEADVAFFSASGSEFMEMLVGMWAAKVRTLFKSAKEAWRAIIFIDEIDAIGKKRWNGTTWWHQEQEQTLNQILTEMDGFDNQTNIIVMAATNRPDILDPALLRAGRFDRKVYVTSPTAEERTEIFNYYLKKKQVSEKVNLKSLVKRTSGLVWADIENIVNEASLRIAKDGRTVLEPSDFEYALEKVIMWPEKKSKWIQEKEKRIIAFHELGHALLAHVQPEADAPEKISIVRRWHALGLTWITPAEDRNLYSKSYILSEVAGLLGWRASEEIFFGKDNITTGASNDFERANKIIRDMITKYGMDPEIGLVVYPDERNSDFSFYKPYSEETAEIIDEKVKKYLEDAYKVAKNTILEHKETMEKIAELLIKKEYISGEDFSMMVENPDKIEEFKNADEIVTNAEENHSLSFWVKWRNLDDSQDSSAKPQNDKWNTQDDEWDTKDKKTVKKPTSRKKS